jgi:tRNA uridine 5-carbamoylmethylation protein Kti12
MSACVVVVLVYGLPGSGKTTLVRQLAKSLRAVGGAVDVVELDASLHDLVAAEGEFRPEHWHVAFDEFRRLIVEAVHRGMETPRAPDSSPSLVIAVDNMQYRSLRQRILRDVAGVNAASSSRAGFATVCVGCPPSLCAARNMRRTGPHRVPDAVVHVMARQLEVGPVARQPECTSLVTINDSELVQSYPEFATTVDNAVQAGCAHVPLPFVESAEVTTAREASRAANLTSLKHQLDLTLRRHVGELMQGLKASDSTSTSSVGQALAHARKAILDSVPRTIGEREDGVAVLEILVETAASVLDRALAAALVAAQQ